MKLLSRRLHLCDLGPTPSRLWLVVLCALLSSAAPAGAQQTTVSDPLDFDSVVARALAASSVLSVIQDTLADKLAQTGVGHYFEGVGMSLGAAIGGNPEDPFSYSGNSAFSANIALLPQLSVNGSFSAAYASSDIAGFDPASAQVAGSVGLAFTPLADTTAGPQNVLEVEQTRMQLETTSQAASYAAISGLLNALMAQLQTDLDELEAAVAEKALRATEALYQREQVSRQAYLAAKNSLRAREHDLLLSRLTAEKALESLAHIVGMTVDQFRLPALEELGLGNVADQAVSFLNSANAERLAERTAAVRFASISVQDAEIDLSAARVFSPSLSITASTTLPDLNYSVGVQFSFSVSDFDSTARDSARKSLSQARTAYQNTLSLARFDARGAVLELQIALAELKVAEEALAESRLALAETLYFVEQGEATELALAQSELAVRSAEYAQANVETIVARRWFEIAFYQF